ncbi:MAG: hypothetical protein ABI699_07155 [Caldimonas sp.]
MALPLLRHAGALRARLATAFALVAAATLSACAAPSAPSAPSAAAFEMRVLVKLVRPSEDATAIAAEASRQAGVPARYAASVSTVWHALSLRCADAAACGAALARLRQASGVYQAVEPEGRKQRAVM